MYHLIACLTAITVAPRINVTYKPPKTYARNLLNLYLFNAPKMKVMTNIAKATNITITSMRFESNFLGLNMSNNYGPS